MDDTALPPAEGTAPASSAPAKSGPSKKGKPGFKRPNPFAKKSGKPFSKLAMIKS